MMKSSQLKINLFIFNHVHIIFAQLWRKNQSLIMRWERTYHLPVLDSVALPITIHNSHSKIFAWNSITLITSRKIFIYLFEEMVWINSLKTNEYQTMFGCTYHKYGTFAFVWKRRRIASYLNNWSRIKQSAILSNINGGTVWQGKHVSRSICYIYIDPTEHGGNSHICRRRSFIFKTTRTASS